MFMTKINNSLHVRYKITFTSILKFAKVLNSTLFSFLFLPFSFPLKPLILKIKYERRTQRCKENFVEIFKKRRIKKNLEIEILHPTLFLSLKTLLLKMDYQKKNTGIAKTILYKNFLSQNFSSFKFA